MKSQPFNLNPYPTRRQMLTRSGMGFASMGLASLMANEKLLAAPTTSAIGANPMAPKQPHYAPKAKRVIHIFLNGGPSHVDTFDPKPMLDKYHGKLLPKTLKTERETGAAFKSPFKFKRYGQSGLPISELFSELGQHADDLCVIRSMQADVPNHEPSLMLMNTGASVLVRPSMGSWVTYGLGSENQNLPGFIAMCPGGYPVKDSQNWQSAFLPGTYQGTHIDTAQKDINKLIANLRPTGMTATQQRNMIDLAQAMNRNHAEQRQNETQLETRIQSYELAYNMQSAATDAFDVSREPKHTLEAYGNTHQGRQLLMARRLIERGVRYVQVWHGKGQPWDNHFDIEKGHRKLAAQCSSGIAALIGDLKQRGLLDETLVIFGGEFGRTPVVELPKPGAKGSATGRDHNNHGFTMWMAGGGTKGGYIHGATDEFGFEAVQNKVHVNDMQATALHLLGFDHEKLTYRFSGRDYRLTDIQGSVVRELIA